MDIVKEDDLADLAQQCILIQVVEHGIELVGIGVFAVHHDCRLLSLIQEGIDAVLGNIPGIGDLAHILEAVLVFFVQKAHKLLVIKQDIALAASAPVDVDLEGIVPAMGIVLVARSLHPFRFGAVRHNKERPDIVPLQPDWQQALDIVDPVCNFPVDVHDILVQRIVCFDDLNSVLAELPNRFLVNVLWKGVQIFDIVIKCRADLGVVLLNAVPDQAQVSNDPCIFVLIHFGIMLPIQLPPVKNLLGHADQIADFGNDHICIDSTSLTMEQPYVRRSLYEQTVRSSSSMQSFTETLPYIIVTSNENLASNLLDEPSSDIVAGLICAALKK